MSSENAKAVAKEVVLSLRKSKKVNLGKIIRAKGYSKSVSLAPQNVTDTKSFQEEIRPVVEQFEKERQRLITEISSKDLSKVKYEEAVRALDIFTKNIQLLGGKPTEQTEVKITGINYIVPNGNNSNTNPETA